MLFVTTHEKGDSKLLATMRSRQVRANSAERAIGQAS
jgi:hypothetical protein